MKRQGKNTVRSHYETIITHTITSHFPEHCIFSNWSCSSLERGSEHALQDMMKLLLRVHLQGCYYQAVQH